MEDSAHWAKGTGLFDELLCSLQCAHVSLGHQHLHITTLPLAHSLQLVT